MEMHYAVVTFNCTLVYFSHKRKRVLGLNMLFCTLETALEMQLYQKVLIPRLQFSRGSEETLCVG